VSNNDDFRDPSYWRARAKAVRTEADQLDDVVAKAQMIDRADEFDVKAKRAAEVSARIPTFDDQSDPAKPQTPSASNAATVTRMPSGLAQESYSTFDVLRRMVRAGYPQYGPQSPRGAL